MLHKKTRNARKLESFIRSIWNFEKDHFVNKQSLIAMVFAKNPPPVAKGDGQKLRSQLRGE
jgi:hypothetical protein